MTAAEGPEVLHYVRDTLGSVVGLIDAGDPEATPEPIPAKLVERYDYDPYGKTYVEYWDATGGTGGEGAWVRTADAASHFGKPTVCGLQFPLTYPVSEQLSPMP